MNSERLVGQCGWRAPGSGASSSSEHPRYSLAVKDVCVKTSGLRERSQRLLKETTNSRRSEKSSWEMKPGITVLLRSNSWIMKVFTEGAGQLLFKDQHLELELKCFAAVSSKEAISLTIGSFSRQIQAQIQHPLMKSTLLKGSVLGRLISFKLDSISSRAYQPFLS